MLTKFSIKEWVLKLRENVNWPKIIKWFWLIGVNVNLNSLLIQPKFNVHFQVDWILFMLLQFHFKFYVTTKEEHFAVAFCKHWMMGAEKHTIMWMRNTWGLISLKPQIQLKLEMLSSLYRNIPCWFMPMLSTGTIWL